MIRIPLDQLTKEVLYNIAESFVLREGTDYGMSEHSLPDKVARVLNQIERGEIILSYDEPTESCNLLTRHEAVQNGLL